MSGVGSVCVGVCMCFVRRPLKIARGGVRIVCIVCGKGGVLEREQGVSLSVCVYVRAYVSGCVCVRARACLCVCVCV